MGRIHAREGIVGAFGSGATFRSMSSNSDRRVPIAFPVLAVLLASGCNEPCPHYAAGCRESSSLPVGPAVTQDLEPRRYAAALESPGGIVLETSTGAIRRFVGADSFKLALATGKHLYLLLPDPDTSRPPRVFRMDRGDEGPNGNAGWPNEPLFSPDGRWLAYAGDFPKARTNAYVREAVDGSGWRVPVVRPEGTSAHPHWYQDGTDLWLFVSDVATTTAWDAGARTNNGATWKARFRDSSIDAFQAATLGGNRIPGAFKGGLSRDGRWAGTSYQQSLLWNAASGEVSLLNGGYQQCNPSMNPFAGGANTDFMMILGFGGAIPVPTPEGNVLENQHEHLWIWSKDDRAVWKASLPNVAPHPSSEVPGTSYYEWQRPEWSTHPDFATAFAKRTGTGDGVGYDLFVVKLGPAGGELAVHDRRTTLERGPVLRVASGDLISSDWSHLWVKP